MACGSGAKLSANTRPLAGTFPSVVASFQQRLLYANTLNNPMTLWGSRVDELDNWSASGNAADDDAYSFTIDSESIDPILHMISVQNGLLVFTPRGVSQLTGGQSGPVTPNSALFVNQSFVGAADTRPVVVGDEILYARDQYRSIQLLTFNPTARRFDNAEISTLSRHLFTGASIRSIAFTHAINRKGVGVFEDGSGFMLTLASVQQVFAFSPLTTTGFLKDVISIQFGQREQFYFVVEREGFTSVELMEEPGPTPEEEVWLDAALTVPLVFPKADLRVTAREGEARALTDADVFTAGDAGSVIGVGGGRAKVTDIRGPREAVVVFERPASIIPSEPNFPIRAKRGSWWMNEQIGSVSGLPFREESIVTVVDGLTTGARQPSGATINLPKPTNLADILCGLPPVQQEDRAINFIFAMTITNEGNDCGVS